MKKNNWSSPDLIQKKILLIDGITRSGKSMIGPVIASFKNTYPMRYQYLIDNLMPIFSRSEINKNVTKSLISLYFNREVYELNISRNINFRRSDVSSIFRDKNQNLFIKNLKKKEGDYVVKEIKKKKFWSLYETHDLLSMINNFRKLEIPFKMIYCYRHPIDNIYSFYKRYKNRLSKAKNKYNLNNPRIYFMMIKNKGILLPYYADKNKTFFLKLNFAEKVAFYYLYSLKKSQIEFKKNKKNKNDIFFVKFDDFATNTKKVIKKLSQFTSSSLTKFTKNALKNNNLPRKINLKEREVKKKYLKKLIRKDLFKKIEILSKNYENNLLF